MLKILTLHNVNTLKIIIKLKLVEITGTLVYRLQVNHFTFYST